MIIRRQCRLPCGGKFVSLAVVAVTLIGIVLDYFHSSFIDAFSLGLRKLPSTQVFNQQQQQQQQPLQDSLSLTFISTRNSPSSSSYLEIKGTNDDDSPSPFFAKRELDESAKKVGGGSTSSSSASSSPFFARREGRVQKTNEPPPIFDQEVKKAPSPFFGQWEGRVEMKSESPIFDKDPKKKDESSNGDSASIFFASNEEELQILNESLDLDKVQSIEDPKNVGIGDSTFPFFATKEEQLQMLRESLDLEAVESKEDPKKFDSSESSSPLFATKEDAVRVLKESFDFDESESNADLREVGSVDSASPFFATKEDQLEILRKSLDLDRIESNEDRGKVENSGRSFPSPFFAEKEAVVREIPMFKQPLQKPSFDNPSFVAMEQTPMNYQFSANSQEERENSASDASFEDEKPIESIPKKTPSFKKDAYYEELVDSFKKPGDDTSEIVENTIKTVVDVIKGLPSQVEKAVDTSQKILKDVQGVSQKVNESIKGTKKAVEETVEKTQETVKDVQDFSIKVKSSLDATKETVEAKVEKTQEIVKDVQDVLEATKQNMEERVEKTQEVVKDVKVISNRVKQSLEDTKQTVEEKVEKTQEKTQKTIKDVQVISKKIRESEAASKAKVLFQVEPPTTLGEEALDLAGKAAIAAAKVALWGTKKVGSFALKNSKSIYDKTIGPEVEGVWNEQMESWNDSVDKATGVWKGQVENINSSVEKATGAWNDQVESLNTSVEEAALYVKNTPSRVKSVVTETIRDMKNPKQNSDTTKETKSIEQPPSVQQDLESVSGKENVPNEQSRGTAQDPVSKSTSPMRSQPTWRQQAPVSVSNSAKDKNQPAFVSRKEVEEDREDDDSVARESKGEEKIIMPIQNTMVSKTPNDLDKELEEAELLARELSKALDAAERAMKITNIELDEPMIDFEEKSMERIETVEQVVAINSNVEFDEPVPGIEEESDTTVLSTVQAAESQVEMEKKSSDTIETAEEMMTTTSNELEKTRSSQRIGAIAFVAQKRKADREKKNQGEAGVKQVLSRFNPPSFQTPEPSSFQRAKTQEELDAELQQAASLAKEIADALDSAEIALGKASQDIQSIEKEIDEWAGNITSA